ncbi:hypothetical protein V8F20_004609 [Naviculisporaceae sp. PSN 640]
MPQRRKKRVLLASLTNLLISCKTLPARLEIKETILRLIPNELGNVPGYHWTIRSGSQPRPAPIRRWSQTPCVQSLEWLYCHIGFPSLSCPLIHAKRLYPRDRNLKFRRSSRYQTTKLARMGEPSQLFKRPNTTGRTPRSLPGRYLQEQE